MARSVSSPRSSGRCKRRLQLAGTSVKVVEFEPPAARTALLPGQQDSEFAMPLEEFMTEPVALLESGPEATEIEVERVKFLRDGEARGDYDQVVKRSTPPTRNRSWAGQRRTLSCFRPE